MFESWQNFYLLMGPSAAALVGWLFVVATLTTGSNDYSHTARAMAIYSTPIVFHLAMILLVSALMLMPHVPVTVLAAVVILAAGAGLIYSAYVGRAIWNRQIGDHRGDVWSYALLPLAAYAAALAAGLGVVLDWAPAPWALAGGLLAQLLAAIHNAWDLVSFMSPRVGNRTPPATD